jgi:hypothetical protein
MHANPWFPFFVLYLATINGWIYIPTIIGSIQQCQMTKMIFYPNTWVLVLVDLLYALFEEIIKVVFNLNFNFILNLWIHLSLLCIFKPIDFSWKFYMKYWNWVSNNIYCVKTSEIMSIFCRIITLFVTSMKNISYWILKWVCIRVHF